MKTKYRIGDIVCHTKQGYIGVIIDVDGCFSPRGNYESIGTSKIYESPWYRVLVDNTSFISYVKESFLEKEHKYGDISHPELNQHLKRENGRYVLQKEIN